MEMLETFTEHFWNVAGDIPCFELENLFSIKSRNVPIIWEKSAGGISYFEWENLFLIMIRNFSIILEKI